MPTVLRIGPYRFHFYSREDNEPPHIHVTREDLEAKFWLRPVSLAANRGFAQAELHRIRRLVEEHVGAETKGDGCEFKRRQAMGLCYVSLGRGLEEA